MNPEAETPVEEATFGLAEYRKKGLDEPTCTSSVSEWKSARQPRAPNQRRRFLPTYLRNYPTHSFRESQ